MQYLEELIDTPDGHAIPVKAWRPRHPSAVLVIAHGMAEHASRYAPLAEWLTEQDVAVVALEQRGHSDHCLDEDLGHYADEDGWNMLLSDLKQVVDFAKELEPDCPVTLFGHSMGSFIAQAWIQRYGDSIDNLMLCSTNRINLVEVTFSKALVHTIKALRGPRHISGIITALLSIDPTLWRKDLPVHILSGTADPVGEKGYGIGKHITALKAAGVQLASVQLYEGARHELVNETNASEVWQHINNGLVRNRAPG